MDTWATICFITSGKVEKYNRVMRGKRYAVKEEKNTEEYQCKLVAESVANIMKKAGVNLNQLILTSDGVAAVTLSIFCAKMVKPEKGFVRKATSFSKRIFGM